jgi:hypothetical protein
VQVFAEELQMFVFFDDVVFRQEALDEFLGHNSFGGYENLAAGR